MEIIKYNIEKLGGIESTLSRMEPSLRTFEMRNIEKNMESVNQPAVHPKFFDSSKAFASSSNLPRSASRGLFPYGSSGQNDPKDAGQYQRNMTPTPDMSNYPCRN